MDKEPFDLLSDQRLAWPWRAALVLVGLATVAGGAFFGLYEMVTLGTSYAHDSSPTLEFGAAGDAKMLLACVLMLFGGTCLFCRRANHLLMVAAAAAVVLLCAGVVAWREKARKAAEPHPYVIAVEPQVPPPTHIVVPPEKSR